MEYRAPASSTIGDDKDEVDASRSVSEESCLGSLDEETKATEPRHATPQMTNVPADPAPATRGRRAYGQRRVSEEHKRERNRATFRRFYQRKQQTLRELREAVSKLTEEYERLKVSNQVTDPSSIMQLISVKDSLTAEQAELQHVAQEQLKARRWLQRLVDNAEHDTTTPLLLPPPVMDFDITAVLDQAIYDLSELQAAPEHSPEDIAFGWHCQLQQDDDLHITFHLTKEFSAPDLPLAETSQRTWAFESKSTTSSRTPSSAVRTTRRVLPRSEDEMTRLVFRQLVRAHQDTTDDDNQNGVPRTRSIQSAKSVYAVALVELASGGFAVVSCSVPNQAAYDPGDDPDIVMDLFPVNTADLDVLLGGAVRHDDDQWIEELSWWRIEPCETGVRVTYAGFAPVYLGLSPSACFMEVLQRAVQWEQVVLGAMPIDVATPDPFA